MCSLFTKTDNGGGEGRGRCPETLVNHPSEIDSVGWALSPPGADGFTFHWMCAAFLIRSPRVKQPLDGDLQEWHRGAKLKRLIHPN